MMYGWGNFGGPFAFGGGLIMMIGMLLFWALVIGGIIYAVRAFTTGQAAVAQTQAATPNALEILRERYARGEVDTEEFETRKRQLTT